MRHLVLAGVLLASTALFSCEKDDDDEELNKTDIMFITGAAISNTAEVQAGQLAAAKATNPAIKAYGVQMVAEHSLAQVELKVVGSRVGVQVADTVDARHRALMQQLNSLSGREFDSVYIHSQVIDHQNTLNLFETEIEDGSHDSVQAYANKYRPHIEMHLVEADSLAEAY
jgi:putative membrane protein